MLRTLTWAFIAQAAATAARECHPQGPIFPRPSSLTQSGIFQDALNNLAGILDKANKGDINGGWDTRNVSMSIGIVTLDQPEPSVPAWEYHHLASGNTNGTKHVDRDSQYLVGSVSKVISVAVALRSGVDLNKPVTDYLPSLADLTSLISWEDITLRALTSQMSGIPPNYGFSEYYYLKPYFESLGFPQLNDSKYAECGIIGLNKNCDKEQFLRGMLQIRPVTSPFTRPVYSNIAYQLLFYALEAHTGKNFTQLLTEHLTTPFNLPSTFPSGSDKADTSRAVIPPIDNNWGVPYGDAAPQGGLVSTLSDLSSFLSSILHRTLLPTVSQTTAWLNPAGFAGSPNSAVGGGWEMYRPPPGVLFPSHGDDDEREEGPTVTILSKDGGAYGYHARIALLDEYGFGIVILTAGDLGALQGVYDAILSVVVPAAHAAAREVVERGYVGQFKGVPGRDEKNVSVGVSMETELDGKSLKMTGLRRNGTDMMAAVSGVWAVTLGTMVPELEMTKVWRLYPAGVERESVGEGGRKVVEEDWRVWWDLEMRDTELPGSGLSKGDCRGWMLEDWLYHGGEALDRVVFVRDAETGDVLGVDVPFLRTGAMEKGKGTG